MLPGATPFAVGIIFFVPKSFSLSNMVILSLKKTSVQKDDSIWNTLKSMSQMSKPPMWFVGTKYIFLHSEKRLLYPKMRSLSRDRPSSGVVFRCIQSSGLSPIWTFSPVKVEKVTVSRFRMFLVYCLLLFSPEFNFQSCPCYGENIRSPLFLVPGYVSAWTISR